MQPRALKAEPDAERLLATFLEMVRIDSPSGVEDAMRDYLVARIEDFNRTLQSKNGSAGGVGEALGTHRLLTHRTDAGGNLIVEVPPPNRGEKSAKTERQTGISDEFILVLSGHMDVVPPCIGIQPVVEELAATGENEADRIIRSDNTTVLGADDKAGLAPILEAVFCAVANDLPRPRIRMIFTTREETRLGGAKELDDEALRADFALTLDHTGRQGVIIHQAPTYIDFEVVCRGKSVHAGIMPEQGVNAVAFAGKVIEQLHLGRVDDETTANIGFILGGKATNIVPDECRFQGELRSHNEDSLARELRHIEAVLADISASMPGTSYEFSHETSFEAYRMPPEHPGIVRVSEAARQTGLEPQLFVTNGGSDNNVFVKRGLPGVVLSAGFIEPHALSERVKLSEMRLCCRFLLNCLEVFAEEESWKTP